MVAATVLFCQEILEYLPEKNIFFPILTLTLALMMVSSLKFHGLKEVDFREKKPFWILLFFILLLFFIVIHPPVAVFVLASIYVVSGIIENIIILIKHKRKRPEVQDEKDKNI